MNSPAASITFQCYRDGRVVADLWAGSATEDIGAWNAYAIARLVRLAMTAPESVRMKIKAALDEAEETTPPKGGE